MVLLFKWYIKTSSIQITQIRDPNLAQIFICTFFNMLKILTFSRSISNRQKEGIKSFDFKKFQQ